MFMMRALSKSELINTKYIQNVSHILTNVLQNVLQILTHFCIQNVYKIYTKCLYT